ncbi:putative terpene synthase [Diaporthe ampelina]|uniref:Terpene synthase n=1 Tax=Diaporthe ampelina TaxID=1214573 RepID=A0A0G2H655_9PEZI|nr:putative terpene synthase [Diaporthe ampelina]
MEQPHDEKLPYPVDPNTALANELRGQKFRVDMTNSFCGWPCGARNPYYRRLQIECDRVLEIGVPDPARCKKFKKSDFALFSVLWWPSADWEDLYTAMLFTVALFVWDDTIDTNEHMLASNFAEAEVWRTQSLAYFRYHLQLSQDEEPHCPDDICLLFKEFAGRFCKSFGDEQRRRMYSKIEHFVAHNRLEQAERLAGRIPNYDEYMDIRYGVTGVRMFTLLLEITQQTKLPAWVMDSSEMEQIVEECNFIIIVVNDILSLKKEIATDCVVNIVPVLYKTGLNLDRVIPSLIDEMHASRDRLDSAAARLHGMTLADPQLNQHVMNFIDGVRIMGTGTLEYSIEAMRYDVRKYLQPDGTLDIVL